MRRYWGQQKPPLGVPADKGHILCPSSGLWLMNEGHGSPIVQDLSGNGNTGTLGAAGASPSWGGGQHGSALSFDGGDHVNLTGVTDSSTSHTIVMNVYATATGPGDYMLDFQTGRLLFAFVDDAGTSIALYDGTSWRQYGASLLINTWYQLIFILNGATGKTSLYVNGVLYGSEQTYTPRVIGGTASLGSRYSMDSYWFNGLVEYLYIYNHVKSISEIAQLYEEPFCMVRTRRRRVIFDEIAGVPPTSSPYYYREIASRRIA